MGENATQNSPVKRMARPKRSKLLTPRFVRCETRARLDASSLTLRATECSDGMSDRVCPLEAEILHKGETLKGCANSEAALDALPKP